MRWKLIHKILPNKFLLHKWKLNDDPFCNLCHVIEDYKHYFIDCEILNELNTFLKTLFQKEGITKNLITLKYYVFGYKIYQRQTKDINEFLTIVMFCIYKSYHVSDQKTKNINPLKIFNNELHKQIQNMRYQKRKIPKIYTTAADMLVLHESHENSG